MTFDQINAFGVQRGQVSPAEQFRAQQEDAARRAHMAALMAGAGGRPSAPTGMGSSEGFEPYQQKEAQIIGNTGTPYAPIDMLNRQVKAGMDMQGLEGQQAMDLSKESTNRAFGTADRQMAGVMGENQRKQTMFDEEAPIRAAKQKFQAGALAGGPGSSDDDMMKFAMGMGQDVTPFLQSRSQDKQIALQEKNRQRAIMDSLIAAHPELANKLGPNLGSFEGLDPATVQEGLTPPVEEYLGKNTGITDQLKNMTGNFANRDIAVTGWDPTEGDIVSIINERNRVMGILRQKGYPPEVAQREATRIVEMSLGDDQNDVNAGWIQQLKGRL